MDDDTQTVTAASIVSTPAAAAPRPIVDVVLPPTASVVASAPAPVNPALVPAEESVAVAPEQSVPPSVDTPTPDVKASTPEKPAKLPKQPSTTPVGAIIGAILLFCVLAVVAVCTYMKGQ